MRWAVPATHNVGRPAGGNLRFPTRSGAKGNKAARKQKIKRSNNLRSPNTVLTRRHWRGRPPAAPAAHRPSGGGTRRGFFLARRCFLFWFFVSALNCVSYGEPDVRPAGRPFGRVRLSGACAALCVAATVCVAGYCAWVRPAVSGRLRPFGRGAPVNGKRPTGAVIAVPRGSANRERRRRRRVAGSFRRRGVCRVVILILVFLLTH